MALCLPRRCFMGHGVGPAFRGLCLVSRLDGAVGVAAGHAHCDSTTGACTTGYVVSSKAISQQQWAFVAVTYDAVAGTGHVRRLLAYSRMPHHSYPLTPAHKRVLFVAGMVSLYVDGVVDASPWVPVVDSDPSRNAIRVGATYTGVGLAGCVDEVFVLSTVASRGELEYLSQFHQTLLVPSVAGSGYALTFQRGADTAVHGGFVEVDNVGARQTLGYSNTPTDAMTFAAWIRPVNQDQAHLLSPVDGVRVQSYVLVDKSAGRSADACAVPEYRISLEGVPDRTGASSKLTYELRVDVGAVSEDASASGVAWADQWPTGKVLSDAGDWTHVAVTWNVSTLQAFVNGSVVVRVRTHSGLVCCLLGLHALQRTALDAWVCNVLWGAGNSVP